MENYKGTPYEITHRVQYFEKILNRPDLLYRIAEHVILDPGKQSIVEVTLKDKLKEINNTL